MSESIKRNYLDKAQTTWVDADGTMHIDAVKCCKVLGMPPTQQNQDAVERAARQVFAKEFPQASVAVKNDLL